MTAAELRLLPMLATHLSFPEIAAQMFLSRNTVKSEAVAIYRKLEVSSAARQSPDRETSASWMMTPVMPSASRSPPRHGEASEVRWVATTDLEGLDVHPTQWRQLRDWLDGSGPHVDWGKT